MEVKSRAYVQSDKEKSLQQAKDDTVCYCGQQHLHNLLDNSCAANDKEYSMKVMEALGMAYQRYG